MKTTSVLGVLIVAAVLGLCIHGVVTETGPVGWLNAAQQSVFGAYSMKMSLLLSLFAFAIVGGALYAGASTVFGDSGPPAVLETPEPVQPVTAARTLAVVFGAMIALTWAIGLGLYAWSQHQDRTDTQASYPPLALQTGQTPDPQGDHFALSGRALLDRVVVHSRGKSGSRTEDYRLVPLAPPDWQPGQAVSFIAKVRSETEITGPRRWQPPPRPGATRPPVPERPPLLVRLDGSVPVPAVQAFKEMGVPLASRAWLVHVVPSLDGRPDIRDESQQEWTLTLTFCSAISGVLLLLGAVFAFRSRSGAPATSRAVT